MNWIKDLLFSDSVAHTILIYCIVISTGVILGKIRIYGVSLGIAFVLFAGIALGHFGFSANPQVVDFIREFGLILFVFSIGLQVGPGFFSSFKRGGLILNLLALAIVLIGGSITLILHLVSGVSLPMLTGIMSGAVTNTPGLGAAQQALTQISPNGNVPEISIGYAVAYPFGVLGIIMTMLLIRKTFSINVENELSLFNRYQHPEDRIPEKISILVTNKELSGRTIKDVTSSIDYSFIVSRILHKSNLQVAGPETIIHEGDIILIVAQKRVLPQIISGIGEVSKMDLTALSGKLISRRIFVSNREVFGKKLGSLKLRTKYNINITRIYRSGIEFVASPEIRLQMGDKLTIVGDEDSLKKVTEQLGDSINRLDEPNIIPIFIGILAGVILGSIPIKIPGIIHPVKLGLAGGPLIVAILLSKYGYKFQLVSYTTPSANLMLREIGIVLFLASVGITAGAKFVPAILSGDGFVWMGYGAVITLLPLLLISFLARIYLKRNYLELCGLLAGSMTDPPALAFANSIAATEAPAVAYATVYPLVMFLRIFVAQLLIILFA